MAKSLFCLLQQTSYNWQTLQEAWPNKNVTFPFEVMPKVPHPDNYYVDTGRHFSLYSDRLINIIRKFNIEFDTFSVNMVDKKNKDTILADKRYKLCRFYKKLPIVHHSRGDNYPHTLQMVIEDKVAESAPALVVLSSNSLIFVREDLKSAIEEEEITGCHFCTVDQYVEDIKHPVFTRATHT